VRYAHQHGVYVEDIFDKAAKELREQRGTEFTREGVRELQTGYPKALHKRPDYSQLVKDTEKICKIHYLNPSFLGKVMKGSIAYASTQSVVWIATGNSMAGIGAGAVSSLAYYTYAMQQQKKTEAKWAQQEKDQKSIDETVKKLMQGKNVEEITPENKTDLLSRINSALTKQVPANWQLPLLGSIAVPTASAAITTLQNMPVEYRLLSVSTSVGLYAAYLAPRMLLPRLFKELRGKDSEAAEQKEETPLVNPLTGNEMHIFSPVGAALIKEMASRAYASLRKKFSKEKKAQAENDVDLLAETPEEAIKNTEPPAPGPVQESYQQNNEPEPKVEELKPVPPEPLAPEPELQNYEVLEPEKESPEPQDSDDSEPEVEDDGIMYEGL